MEIEKVRLFITACVMYATGNYLTGLKPEELICLYEECLAMALFLHDTFIERLIYGPLGDAYKNIHQLEKAIECYEKCLVPFVTVGYREGEMAIYERLGNAHLSIGKCHEAVKYHKKYLSIATEIGDRRKKGNAYRNLGNTFRSLGKNHEAIKYHEKHLNIATEIGDRQGQGNAYGNLGNAYQSLGKYHEAIKYHEKHLSIAKEMGNRRREGNAYGSLGNAYRSLSKYHEAIKYHEKHLSIAREMGDREGEGNAYGNLGNAFNSLGKFHEAIKYHKKHLSIAREMGNIQGEGNAYGNLGNAHQSLGKYHEAIKFQEKRLGIATELGDRQGEGNAYGNLGNAYQSLGKYDEAIKCHEKHLSIATETGSKEGKGIACGSLGSTYQSIGKYHEAIKFHEKYLIIATEMGDRQGEGNAYGNLGNAYQLLGKYDEAIKYHEKLLSIATEIEDRQGEGFAYGSLGNAYLQSGKYHEAIKFQEKRLGIATEIGDRQGEGNAYGNLGNAYQLLGKYHEAIKYHEKHLSIATEIGRKEGEGSAYEGLGTAYESLGKYHEAIEYHKKSLSIATEIGDKHGEGVAHHNIGFCYEREGNDDHLRKSKEHYHKSIQCFELLFDDLKGKDQFKISIFDTFIQAYKNLSRLCLKTEQTEEALLVSERRRARALGDLLSLKYNMNEETAPKSGSLKLADVNDMIVTSTSCILFYDVLFGTVKPTVLIWALTQLKPLFYVGSEIKRSESRSAEDKNEHDEQSAITNFVNKSYHSILLREGVDCEDRSLGMLECEKQDFVKHPVLESSQFAERETTREGIKEKVSVQARCVEDHEVVDEKPLELLFETLVAPVQDKLIQEEVVIIPDGPLFMVPFAALQDPKTGKFLSEMKRIRLSPSLTTLKLLQESPDDHHYKSGALIVGNPEIGKVKFEGEERSFCDLPGARKEAEEIAELLEVEPLIGRQATKEAVLQKLRVGVSVIHFAAHGSENGQILLAPSPSSATNSIPDEVDYVLTMQEAQESGLRAQLVVLSCCHSGRGEIKAEGVVGLTRAFLAAGARAVVASLWAIADEATKVFMLKFYSHLKRGESASRSLQQAMKYMRETERYEEPSNWAAFFLIGDDVTIKT